jgi:UDP:flavonoid glycosyltransferase YjiC (YdhE family)
MAHIHLCWELGGGLGHAGRLKMLAQALLARGHRVTMSLRDLMHTHALLADLDVPKLQAPVWLHDAVGLPSPGNLAEILFRCGYLEPAALHGVVGGWRAMFALLQPDLVVADFAPTALLAARSMGLRTASVGNGFNTPPRGQPLPALRQAPAERLAASEARMLATANAVLAAFGADPYTQAADAFLGGLPLLCTWPELDHYARDAAGEQWLGPNFVDEGGLAPYWPEGEGAKVYAYLKASHPAHGAVLKALVEEGCRVLAYVPEVAAGAPPPVVSEHLLYADAPLALAPILAAADLCVCHAGEATLAQALLAGVPLLMLPSHAEQFLTARRVAVSGAGYNAALLAPAADWRAAVRGVLDEARYGAAAQAFAARRQGFDQRRMNQQLTVLLERHLV